MQTSFKYRPKTVQESFGQGPKVSFFVVNGVTAHWNSFALSISHMSWMAGVQKCKRAKVASRVAKCADAFFKTLSLSLRRPFISLSHEKLNCQPAANFVQVAFNV